MRRLDPRSGNFPADRAVYLDRCPSCVSFYPSSRGLPRFPSASRRVARGAPRRLKNALEARRLDTSACKGQLSYLVTNAGTYMYLTNERPEDTSARKDDFNDYRYGVEDNELDYFTGTSPDSSWRKLAEYPLTLLLRDQDTEKEGDQSCPALAQDRASRRTRVRANVGLALRPRPAIWRWGMRHVCPLPVPPFRSDAQRTLRGALACARFFRCNNTLSRCFDTWNSCHTTSSMSRVSAMTKVTRRARGSSGQRTP